MTHSTQTSETFEFLGSNSFGQYVRNHVLSWTVLETYFVIADMLANEVIFDVNVFRPSVKLWIFRHRYSRLIVLVYQGRLRLAIPQKYQVWLKFVGTDLVPGCR